MTNGCFDILHAGHLSSLTVASQLVDVLLVAVNDDASVSTLKGPKRPVNALVDHMALLAGIGCVDIVTSFSGTDAISLLEDVRPDVYAKGADWLGKKLPEREVANRHGIEVILLDLVEGLSTTGIAKKIAEGQE